MAYDANGRQLRKTQGLGKPDYARLQQAIRTSIKSLEVYRVNRREMVREYVGARWSEEGARKPVYLNLVSLYVQIVGRNLISKNPRVMLSTFDKDKKPDVAKMQAWANSRIEEMDLQDTLSRCVVDALFSQGIAKVALARPDDSMKTGWETQAGQPFVDLVDLDDFVYDTFARRFSEATFVGHRYRIPRQAAIERFGRKKAEELPVGLPNKFNATGDERIGVMGRGYYGDVEEFEDQVTVWELYLPWYRKVVTMGDDAIGFPTTRAMSDAAGEILEEQEWLGPDCGPYHFLSLCPPVPGNAMSKGPIMDQIDMHEAVNQNLRKLIRQSFRQKDLTLYGVMAADDADRVKNAMDGDLVACTAPEQIKALSMGGPNAANFTLMQSLKELFSWQAGNLDLMGGLSPQSKTAAQDKMLNENSSRAVAAMQEATISFTSSVLKSLCWYWWNHPQIRMQSSYSPPGLDKLGVGITRTLTPQDRRQTKYSDMNVKVDPYSLLHATPQAKAQAVNGVVQQTLTPLMPLLQQQGVGFDAHAYVHLLAQYMDLPELEDIVVIQEPPTPEEQGGGGGGPSVPEQPRMPVATNRTYTRENVSGTSRRGNDLAMANAMAGTRSGGNPAVEG